ncbi:MAG: alpha/beta fold hydrolase [Solirubrobacteraceae bacterium]
MSPHLGGDARGRWTLVVADEREESPAGIRISHRLADRVRRVEDGKGARWSTGGGERVTRVAHDLVSAVGILPAIGIAVADHVAFEHGGQQLLVGPQDKSLLHAAGEPHGVDLVPWAGRSVQLRDQLQHAVVLEHLRGLHVDRLGRIAHRGRQLVLQVGDRPGERWPVHLGSGGRDDPGEIGGDAQQGADLRLQDSRGRARDPQPGRPDGLRIDLRAVVTRGLTQHRDRIGERRKAALATLDVHQFTLVGHSLGGAVAAVLGERLRDDVAALVLIAPAGFGRIHLAEAIQLPGVRTVVRHGLPLALMNPVSALGVYMAVVGNGHLPDPELVARLRKNAYRWAPGAACANEAITASGRSRRALYRRELDYHGPVLALWGERDRLVPLAHRDGVVTAFPHAEVSVWKKMGHHPQRERPIELARFIQAACARARPSARDAASSSTPPPRRLPAAALTPQPPTVASASELPAVA